MTPINTNMTCSVEFALTLSLISSKSVFDFCASLDRHLHTATDLSEIEI